MMIRSTFTTVLFLAALVALSSITDAQSPNTSSVPSATSATEVARTTGAPSSATITAPPRTGGNFTGIPEFGSLATLIASLVTAKSVNPGNSQATGTSNSAPGGSAAMMATDSRAVWAGLGLVMLTTLVAAMGTLGL
ncbi:hypothetical protein BGZ72_008959 [Mortierella alpina]|nr:hypothetical protein BGZ72_008959 [Mortierella alpina]